MPLPWLFYYEIFSSAPASIKFARTFELYGLCRCKCAQQSLIVRPWPSVHVRSQQRSPPLSYAVSHDQFRSTVCRRNIYINFSKLDTVSTPKLHTILVSLSLLKVSGEIIYAVKDEEIISNFKRVARVYSSQLSSVKDCSSIAIILLHCTCIRSWLQHCIQDLFLPIFYLYRIRATVDLLQIFSTIWSSQYYSSLQQSYDCLDIPRKLSCLPFRTWYIWPSCTKPNVSITCLRMYSEIILFLADSSFYTLVAVCHIRFNVCLLWLPFSLSSATLTSSQH